MLLGRLGRWARLDLAVMSLHMGVLLGLALFDGRRHIQMMLWHKALCLCIIIANVLIIYTLGYIGWNPVGHPSITGIQLRYFIPFVPLVCLLFYQRSSIIDVQKPQIAVVLASYMLALTLWSVIHTLTTYFALPLGQGGLLSVSGGLL
jgi:uncharacterized membrane protein